MKKKNIIWLLGTLVLATIVVLVIINGLPGKIFQGALYNLRPIYTSCHIESPNFKSDDLNDCEQFNKKFLANQFPDGDYTITTKYSDKRLSDNTIPLKISRNQLQCTFLENGYQPAFSSYSPQDQITFQDIKANDSIPLSTDGLVIQLKYQKDGQPYFYDTNICESAFLGQVSDNSDATLGQAKLDYNGFLNSRPRVNEVLISNTPYYQDTTGQTIKTFHPGNIFLRLNAAPEITFKLTIPCSSEIPQVIVPNIETTKPVLINFQGISPDYFKNCGSKLYFSLLNTNRSGDIQIINTPKLDFLGDSVTYNLDPAQINAVNDKNVVFPVILQLSMHLRDRSDSSQVFTLGTGKVTIPSYSPIPPATDTGNNNGQTSTPVTTDTSSTATTSTVTDAQSTSDSTTTPPPTTTAAAPADTTATPPAAPNRPKVRPTAETILTDPTIPGQDTGTGTGAGTTTSTTALPSA